MKPMLKLILIFSSLVYSFYTLADSPVWKVSKNGTHIYLGGTFHLLADSDYPLPESFDKAYAESSTLIFETDIKAMQEPKYQIQLLNAMTISDGGKLEDKIKPETYALLQTFFNERKLPLKNFTYFTPVGVAITIAIMEYQRIGMNPELGVDQHFSDLAEKDKKTRDKFNTPEEQISFFRDLGKGKEDEMILQTLQDIKTISENSVEMKDAWRQGKVKKLNKMYLKEIEKEFPEAYQSLFVDRNNAWIPKIESLFDNKEIEFVLVGAMHMAGKEGLLKQLKKKGYKIENM